jgi:hypothetical protein
MSNPTSVAYRRITKERLLTTLGQTQTALGATLDSDQAVTARAEVDRIIGNDTA